MVGMTGSSKTGLLLAIIGESSNASCGVGRLPSEALGASHAHNHDRSGRDHCPCDRLMEDHGC